MLNYIKNKNSINSKNLCIDRYHNYLYVYFVFFFFLILIGEKYFDLSGSLLLLFGYPANITYVLKSVNSINSKTVSLI